MIQMKSKITIKIGLLVSLALYFFMGHMAVFADHVVVAAVDTGGAPGSFDDPAIWIHPTDPMSSTVLGTNKSSGLYVYDLAGNQIQNVTPSASYNNVDLRYNFPLGGALVDLAVVSQRGPSDRLAIFSIDPATRLLSEVSGLTDLSGFEPYGLAMYHSPADGKFYAFVSGRSVQEVRQYELSDDGNGLVNITLIRTIPVTSLTEGLVADDVTGLLYLAEENIGIYRYGAEPTDGTTRVTIDLVGGVTGLTADVEGLSLYYSNLENCPTGEGYLLASNQGANSYHIYERAGSNGFVHDFEILGASNTDGLDITNANLGGVFADGMFVVQNDDVNFKFVAWADIAAGVLPENLCTDTSWRPRVDPHPIDLAATATPTALLELSWQDLLPDSGECYDVHRSTNPYFTPDPDSLYQANLLATETSFEDSDVDVIGNISSNFFYRLQATNCNGVLVAESNEVGEFDFEIVQDD